MGLVGRGNPHPMLSGLDVRFPPLGVRFALRRPCARTHFCGRRGGASAGGEDAGEPGGALRAGSRCPEFRWPWVNTNGSMLG